MRVYALILARYLCWNVIGVNPSLDKKSAMNGLSVETLESKYCVSVYNGDDQFKQKTIIYFSDMYNVHWQLIY